MTKHQRTKRVVPDTRPGAQSRPRTYEPLLDGPLRRLEHRRHFGRREPLYDLEHERRILLLRELVKPRGQLLEFDARIRVDTAGGKHVHQRSGEAGDAFTAPRRVDGSVSDDAIEPSLYRGSVIEAPFDECLMRVDVRLLHDILRFASV